MNANCVKVRVLDVENETVTADDVLVLATDGLWDDYRNDEDQIGLSYEQIEEAMENEKSPYYEKFNKIRTSNLHKMKPIPVCILPKNL